MVNCTVFLFQALIPLRYLIFFALKYSVADEHRAKTIVLLSKGWNAYGLFQ